MRATKYLNLGEGVIGGYCIAIWWWQRKLPAWCGKEKFTQSTGKRIRLLTDEDGKPMVFASPSQARQKIQYWRKNS